MDTFVGTVTLTAGPKGWDIGHLFVEHWFDQNPGMVGRNDIFQKGTGILSCGLNGKIVVQFWFFAAGLKGVYRVGAVDFNNGNVVYSLDLPFNA